MKLPIYQIDAFSSAVFGGNPAAVCPLDDWLDDATLQAIAAENNLAETAFFLPGGRDGADYHLRWFTPGVEVDLCGHATLATGYLITRILAPERERVVFDSLSGPLTVTREGDRLVMDFPAWTHQTVEPPAALLPALGGDPEAVVATTRDYMVVYRSADEVRALKPDFRAISGLDRFAVLATAPGDNGADCCLRFFAPQAGIDEDPVTGSAHCGIIPYWAERLGKTRLISHQLSARGGEVDCELAGDRVRIGGACALYLEGSIHL